MEIRKANVEDINKLKEIGKRTFSETFASENSEADMAEYLKKSFSNENLQTELSDKNAEFYFAEQHGKVIGYLKVNSGQSQTELQHENALEIERIYVLQEFQGKKAGQLLLEKAISLAKNRNADFVWLGVWEHNQKGMRFYEKNGFVPFDKHIFKLGNDEQTDIMMKLNLR